MIIRRKHTANYTTIGNELFNDERLAADEVGILAFLLSRPNDWEVRRPALMRRWNVGRDAMKRIITNWMKTGWCRAEKTRLANGTFHIVYEIRDQPGPTLSDEEVRRALALVSSEAAEGQFEDSHGPSGRQSHPPPTDPPPTGQPGVADQRAATRIWPIEDSLITESPTTDSVDERESCAREPLISPEAFALADEYRKAISVDPDDGRFAGLAYTTQIWVTRAYDPLVALATGSDIAKKHGHKPLNYHATAVEQRCEAAKSKPSVRSPEVSNGATPAASSWQQSRDNWRRAANEFSTAVDEINGTPDPRGERSA